MSPYGLDSVCGLLLVVALAVRDLSARGGYVLPWLGGRGGRRMVRIACRAQWVSTGRDAACAISALTLLSGLEKHNPDKVGHGLLGHGQSPILSGLLPRH